MPEFIEALLDAPQQLMLWGTLLTGLLLGALLQWSRLCLLRGLVHVRQGNSQKLKAFALAMAAAFLSSQALAWLCDIDLAASIYVQDNPALPVIVLGGLLFGCGMALSNACTGRSLVLAAGGNLRSLVCLLSIALGAGLALSGLLAEGRVWLENLTRFNLPVSRLPLGLGVLLAIGLLMYALRGQELWQSKPDLIGSLLVGVLVSAGWWLTGVVGADEFEPIPLLSISFVAPLFEAQQYLLLSTGSKLSFGVVLVAGVFVGALLRALLSGQFVWEGFDSTARLKRSLTGGLLMGVGGVLSLGCTYGQALSGFSTLAITSLVAIAGILVGAWLTLAVLQKT